MDQTLQLVEFTVDGRQVLDKERDTGFQNACLGTVVFFFGALFDPK